MSKMTIKAGKNKYEILIQKGLLNELHKHIDFSRKIVVITDDIVGPLYLDAIQSKATFAGCLSYTIKNGESSKTFAESALIIDYLIQSKVSRDSLLIALGGGVVGDLTGFVASIYLRGIDYIQIPTTLLSQVDSSIGGKTAVNTERMKNAIGTFYQPSLVLIDPNVLSTLPERHMNNGVAEMIKMAATLDEKLFIDLETKDYRTDLETFLQRSLSLKKAIVEKDPFDQNIRHVLNFGHTIGHAIEAHYNYSKYLHGEAIAIGMVKITHEEELKKRLIAVLQKHHLTTDDAYDGKKLMTIIQRDKKVSSSFINIIQLKKIGLFEIRKIRIVDLFNMI